MNIKCYRCSEIFIAPNRYFKYCESCKIIKKRETALNKIHNKSKLLKESGIEGIDYVIDLWSNIAVLKVFGHQFKTLYPNKTKDDYLNEFPNTQTICKALSTKFGDSCRGEKSHMKQEKLKKLFSDRFMGDKNPNSKKNTSLKERRERSPFCVEFYTKRGFSIEEAETKIKALTKKATTSRDNNHNNTTRIDYYLKRGFSIEEAEVQLKDRQRTFTLEKCIKKYGKKKGTLVFKERHAKWGKLINKKYKAGEFNKYSKYNYSKPEVELFDYVIEKIGIHDKIFYKHNQFFLYDEEQCRFYSYDFVDSKSKKIIEFNGDYWHMNPMIYTSDNHLNGVNATEIWNKDRLKVELAEKNGYKILVVWESEYKNNKKVTIQKCIDFLNT